ncbi:MAG TPA: alpha/beta hydrolase [Acidobacteriaceae bacterium]
MSIDVEPLRLKANGFHFDALSAGSPHDPLVLFLHGFPQFADSWLPILPGIAAAGFRAVAVDQRGYSPGARPPAIEDYAADLLEADVLGFADALAAPRFHLVGHDWGGLVAWRLAARHPQRLASLTVLSTPHWDAFVEAARTDPDQRAKSRYILLFRSPDHLAESTLMALDARLLRAAYQDKLDPARVDENIRRLSEDNALTGALHWYRAIQYGDRIGKVTVPTLYVWGDQDMALGETAALATRAYVDAPYRFERLPGASHWLVEEGPERVLQLVREHLGEHLSPNR